MAHTSRQQVRSSRFDISNDIEVTANALSTLVASVGAAVDWDATNRRVVAAAGGTFGGAGKLKLSEAKTNGQTTCKLLLNR